MSAELDFFQLRDVSIVERQNEIKAKLKRAFTRIDDGTLIFHLKRNKDR